MSPRAALATLAALSLAGCAAPEPPPAAAPPLPSASAGVGSPVQTSAGSALRTLQMHAKRLEPWAEAPFVKQFLAATSGLPSVATRTLYHDKDKTRYLTPAEHQALPEAERAAWKAASFDEEYYYNTKYGSPLSYARALDVLARHGARLAPGARLLDFGYGYIGHLRLLAALGIEPTGIEVDPLLPVLYGDPGDRQGGKIRLVHGFFPRDPKVVAEVGRGYDVVIAKNVLKKGYIHPDRKPDPKYRLIDLGVSDEVALKSFQETLAPGGHFLIFNICPAPSPPDKPFIPWSDGRSPWTRAQYEAAGFRVVEIDRDDFAATNRMAHLLDWDKDPEEKWDVDHDLSVLYTLVVRP